MAGILVRRSTKIIVGWTKEILDEHWPPGSWPEEFDIIPLPLDAVEGREDGKTFLWTGTKARVATAVEIAIDKTQAKIDKDAEEARRQIKVVRDVFQHKHNLPAALIRVLARRFGIDPAVLMTEVRAEAGL